MIRLSSLQIVRNMRGDFFLQIKSDQLELEAELPDNVLFDMVQTGLTRLDEYHMIENDDTLVSQIQERLTKGRKYYD